MSSFTNSVTPGSGTTALTFGIWSAAMCLITGGCGSSSKRTSVGNTPKWNDSLSPLDGPSPLYRQIVDKVADKRVDVLRTFPGKNPVAIEIDVHVPFLP